MSELRQNTIEIEDEVSLKGIIIKCREWWRYLLGKWLIILLTGILGAGLGILYAWIKKPNYVGVLTFVLEDSRSNPLAAYAGIASQFGLDLGVGGSSGLFEGDNILEFLKSRLMVEKTLLSTVSYNNSSMTLADLYIKFNKLDKKWESDSELKGLHFPVGQPRNSFSLKQDSVLDVIQKTLVKKSLEVEKTDKKLNFINVKCTSKNEVFSKVFVERLVMEATTFYVDTKIKRSKVNVDKLQQTADSLEALLNKKTYAVAAAKDINLNPARQVASVGAEVGARDKMVLQTIYGEVIKNLELSKLAMAQETPIVQMVDRPIYPLNQEKLSKVKGAILGFILASFLIISCLILKRIYKRIMLQ